MEIAIIVVSSVLAAGLIALFVTLRGGEAEPFGGG